MRSTRIVWPDPAEPRATLVRVAGGQESVRPLGPRTLLTLEQAAIALGRPIDEVRRAIRLGFLRPARRRPRMLVSLRACHEFLADERAELAAGRATRGEQHHAAHEVFRQIGD